MIRIYAQFVGVILILVGLLGLAGLMGTNLATGFYDVAMGVFFLSWLLTAGREGYSGGDRRVWRAVLVLGVLSILAARYLPDRAPRLGGSQVDGVLQQKPVRNESCALEKGTWSP